MSCSSPCNAARRALLLAACAAAAPAWAADGVPSEVRESLPGARLHGQGRLRFFGVVVYDARLWSTARLAPDTVLDNTLALELRYARPFSATQIAERSLLEMRRSGPIAAADASRWLEVMRRLFPAVQAGDRLTAVLRPGEGARFFHNGRPLGEVADAAFATRFLAIWLGPQTSEPALRDALLAGGTP
jgi:hypothetical protein